MPLHPLAVAAVVAGSVLLAGCAKPTATAAPGLVLDAGRVALAGVVVDDAIRPLAGADVNVTDAGVNATTDANGLFLLPVPPGEHIVEVRHAGFAPLRQTVAVPATGLRGLDLQLVAGAAT